MSAINNSTTFEEIIKIPTINYTIKDLEIEVGKSLEFLKTLGFETGSVTNIVWNRALKVLGTCKRTNIVLNIFTLRFNKKYLEIADPVNAHSTIMHECIHTVKGCMNHGSKFKKIADILNNKYGYCIHRITIDENYSNFMKKIKTESGYDIYCKNCNKFLGHRVRKSNIINHPELYKCPYCYGKIGIKVVG